MVQLVQKVQQHRKWVQHIFNMTMLDSKICVHDRNHIGCLTSLTGLSDVAVYAEDLLLLAASPNWQVGPKAWLEHTNIA